MNNNYPPGVTEADIDREFQEEHECEASSIGLSGKARCIHCGEVMEDDREWGDD